MTINGLAGRPRWFAAARQRRQTTEARQIRPKTPRIATLAVGIAGTVLTALSSIAALVTFVGVVLTINYRAIPLCAIVDRLRAPVGSGPTGCRCGRRGR